MSGYPIHYLSEQPSGALVPAGAGAAAAPIPAGPASTEGTLAPLTGSIGRNGGLNLPPVTRLQLSGASGGSTAVDRWADDRITPETSA